MGKYVSQNTEDNGYNNLQEVRKMKNDFDVKEVEEEILTLGDNLSLIVSLAKYINLSFDDEINYEKRDIQNLIVVLSRIAEKANQNYTNIDKLLEL